ncbi:MAG TPA: sodium:solute symporter [Tepidisphaeraceae bacterium]|nr:sodium:solute symporter [Tepidisphaeraceae bacterium]
MNPLDWLVLLGTMLGIAAFGMWRTRGKRDLDHYLKGDHNTSWIVIGLSVMATQASAVTFLSTPGQGFHDGLGFVQNYFGAPIALMIIAAVFLPIYRKLNVYTAYEYLGQRFDTKTRLLAAGLFLFQRGIGAGITVYAPAIVLSSVLGWNLDLTIALSGLVVIIYTVKGGSQAVTLTQKYQFIVIMAGMITAFCILLHKMPVGLGDAMAIAGTFGKLKAVDYSMDYRQRYTLWSGLLGGMFLALSYFGCDQTQVNRYIGAKSLRESRMGLLFNAVFKIPMQFFILLLGCTLFVFYQFEKPPVYFGPVTWKSQAVRRSAEETWAQLHDQQQKAIQNWLDGRHAGNRAQQLDGLQTAWAARTDIEAHQNMWLKNEDASLKSNQSDYVFITFILAYLPHGLIGLLITVFFAATLSSKAAELNALASTTVVDLYRHVIRTDASDRHYVLAAKWFTVFWGVFAIVFALLVKMAENLIQFGNIVGSLFYGVPLGLFLVAFFIKRIRGDAVFWAAVLSQAMVLLLWWFTPIGYLWFNVIGLAGCIAGAALLQAVLGPRSAQRGFPVLPAKEA